VLDFEGATYSNVGIAAGTGINLNREITDITEEQEEER
jgi:hypothetical protein